MQDWYLIHTNSVMAPLGKLKANGSGITIPLLGFWVDFRKPHPLLNRTSLVNTETIKGRR